MCDFPYTASTCVTGHTHTRVLGARGTLVRDAPRHTGTQEPPAWTEVRQTRQRARDTRGPLLLEAQAAWLTQQPPPPGDAAPPAGRACTCSPTGTRRRGAGGSADCAGLHGRRGAGVSRPNCSHTRPEARHLFPGSAPRAAPRKAGSQVPGAPCGAVCGHRRVGERAHHFGGRGQ